MSAESRPVLDHHWFPLNICCIVYWLFFILNSLIPWALITQVQIVPLSLDSSIVCFTINIWLTENLFESLCAYLHTGMVYVWTMYMYLWDFCACIYKCIKIQSTLLYKNKTGLQSPSLSNLPSGRNCMKPSSYFWVRSWRSNFNGGFSCQSYCGGWQKARTFVS